MSPGEGARSVPILCSAHGFGHLARQLAVGEALRARGVEPVYYTAAPAEVVTSYLPGAAVVPWVVDVGIAQRDSLTEDPERTLVLLDERVGDARVDALASELAGARVAVVDIAPPALEACRRAGVPALAVGNFDWAWVYRHYPPLHAWSERFAGWQAAHPAVELWPGPGLHGFASVRRAGVLGRRRPAADLAALRARPDERLVLVSFGGFGLDAVERLLPRLDGVRWVLAPPMPALGRSDAAYVTDVPYPALVAGVDAVLTKPGYGIYTEAALAGARLVWVDRGAFPEAPWLEAAMRARGDRKARSADAEGFAHALLARLGDARPAPVADAAVEVVADAVEALAR